MSLMKDLLADLEDGSVVLCPDHAKQVGWSGNTTKHRCSWCALLVK